MLVSSSIFFFVHGDEGETVYGGMDTSQFVLPRVERRGVNGYPSESLFTINGEFRSKEGRRRN